MSGLQRELGGLAELASRARRELQEILKGVPKTEWYEHRLKNVGPVERMHWKANGWYRCRCGAERRAREAQRTKSPSGKWVRVCGACGYMCLTQWEPIDPTPIGGAGRCAA